MKDMGVYHRDIKPGNFMYDRQAKRGVIIDFGLAEVDPKYLKGLEEKWKKYEEMDGSDMEEE